ncbi:DUF5673 domain-containing protein [Alloiococcus sp. CFN-8]|uniref:DUF5673 domain-containing protein n=1 Tax=Alloiococcus sp. CFN-8 TaxID=3416081 RepID=UPI003CFA1F9E
MMGLYDIILTIVWGLMVCFSLIDLIFPDISKGKIILRVQKEQLGRRIRHNLYWVAFSIIFALITDSITFSIFIIIFCILQIIKENRPIEIREKGIYFNFIFYKFKKVLSYTWKSKNLLELHLKNNIAYSNLEVKDDEMALKVDEVLQKYAKKE